MKNTTARDAAARLQNILTRDKIQVPEGFSDILKSDLTNLLNNYFELCPGISIEIDLSESSDFSVKIAVKAKRVKTFYCAK